MYFDLCSICVLGIYSYFINLHSAYSLLSLVQFSNSRNLPAAFQLNHD